MDAEVRSVKGIYGGALMGNFVGNGQFARFTSLAAGDITCGAWDMWSNRAQGWLYPPSQPTGVEAYERLRMALTYIYTIPGMPLLYFGDEIGMPGAGMPDNQRMMRFGINLGTNEAATLDFVAALGAARAAHPALRTGSWDAPLIADPEVLAYARSDLTDTVIVLLHRGSATRQVTLPVTSLGIADGTSFSDALAASPTPITVASGELVVSLPARSAAILVSD